jgi:hypothetical protein
MSSRTASSSQVNGKNKNQILNAHKLLNVDKTPSPSMHNTRIEEVDELAKTIKQITNITSVYAFDVSLLIIGHKVIDNSNIVKEKCCFI